MNSRKVGYIGLVTLALLALCIFPVSAEPPAVSCSHGQCDVTYHFDRNVLDFTVHNYDWRDLQVTATVTELYYVWKLPHCDWHIPEYHTRNWTQTFVAHPGINHFTMTVELDQDHHHVAYFADIKCPAPVPTLTATPTPTLTPTPTETETPNIPVPEFPSMGLPVGMLVGCVGIIYLIKSNGDE